MIKKNLFIISMLLFLSLRCFAQQQFENTLFLEEGATSPKADISEVAWIAGHWRGAALGGVVEEIWSPPMGNSMMASFRLVVDDQVKFYELETISEHEDSLILSLKHFSSELHGWEEKDETVDFQLVKITHGKVYFDGMTFEKVGDEEMNVYVVIGGEAKKKEVKFGYKLYR